jgi:hypothetical protein
MKLVVICCHIAKVVQIVCRRACHSRISCPSRRTKVAGIHVSSCRFKHLIIRITVTVCQFKAHFKFIQSQGNEKFCKKHRPIYCWVYQKSSNQHAKNNQYKGMMPNKLKNFQDNIKAVLKLVYCSNLHRRFSIFIHRLSLTPKFLRSHVFLRDWEENSSYSGNTNNSQNKKKYS